MRGLFVTGTDTGVGKTVLAAAVVAALRARGVDVVALKPVITGLDEPPSRNWPPDHELLARAAGCSADEVALVSYGPAVSPHLAAELAGHTVNRATLTAAIRAAARPGAIIVVEGVGGLAVPITESYGVRELAAELKLPLLIAARPGLGTINHTLLTLEAARAADLSVASVVLTPWAEVPGVIECSNLETIARLGKVPVCTLPLLPRGDVELLAAAGETLPLDSWVS